MYLLLIEDRHVQVKMNELTVEGILANVYKDSIALDLQGETTIIQMEMISLIRIKEE